LDKLITFLNANSDLCLPKTQDRIDCFFSLEERFAQNMKIRPQFLVIPRSQLEGQTNRQTSGDEHITTLAEARMHFCIKWRLQIAEWRRTGRDVRANDSNIANSRIVTLQMHSRNCLSLSVCLSVCLSIYLHSLEACPLLKSDLSSGCLVKTATNLICRLRYCSFSYEIIWHY